MKNKILISFFSLLIILSGCSVSGNLIITKPDRRGPDHDHRHDRGPELVIILSGKDWGSQAASSMSLNGKKQRDPKKLKSVGMRIKYEWH